jgi:ribosomal protein S18 acetylase RimI-like enzyme
MTTPDIRLVPKTDEQTADWLPVSMAAYEAARVAAGDDAEQAAAAARASEQQFFPDGRVIEGHALFTVEADGEDAGWLWIGPMRSGSSTWYVWDVAVHESFRGRGIGRAVFAYNEPAIHLYEGLGYATTAMHMQKAL